MPVRELPFRVTTDNGTVHKLVRRIGGGGQGTVYEVEGGTLAAKLLLPGSRRTREDWRHKLAFVRRANLKGLAVCKPLETLREPEAGYVMEFLGGLDSIKSLARPAGNGVTFSEWYVVGGGLRRRLHILAQVAHTLSVLHGRGYVYGDPSPNNIFVSIAPDADEVRLIDTDNIRFRSTPSDGFVTKRYGAPEVVNGRSGVTTLSDAYALAVIAFEVLACTHPLIGDHIHNGAADLENEALRGEHTWIDDPDVDYNRSSRGIPREIVASPRMKDLFNDYFGRGLTEPLARPGLAKLADVLFGAVGSTLLCRHCKNTYFRNRSHCPWCGKAGQEYLLAHLCMWFPGAGGRLRDQDRAHKVHSTLATSDGDSTILRSYHFKGLELIDASEAWVRIGLSVSRDRFTIRNLAPEKRTLWLEARPSGKWTPIGDERDIQLPLPQRQRSYWLHAGDKDEPHVAVGFQMGGAKP